jgi:AcrR family transcriptional regulator
MKSGAPPVRRTQAERRTTTEEALLDAAARLFARHGVDATSLADIAREAGYSRGIVNFHFGSRAALVARLAERAQQKFVADLVASDVGVEAVVELAESYLSRVSHGSSGPRAFFVMWGASFAEEAPLRDVFVGDDARFRRGVDALVRAGQRAGTVRGDVDTMGFSTALVALLRGIAAQFLVAPDSVDLKAASRTCIALIRGHLDPWQEGKDR